MTNVPKTEQSILFTRIDRACLPIQHIGLWFHSWARLWWHNPRRRERLRVQSAFLNHTAELRGRCWDLFAIDRYRGTRVIRCESAHHDIDGVALIKGGAIVNAAGVVTIVTAVGNRAIGPWESAVVACREPAPKADSTVATDASASIASTGYSKAAPAATRSHPAECFIARQKESRGSEENSDVLTERVP